jgi:hypothetical protein
MRRRRITIGIALLLVLLGGILLFPSNEPSYEGRPLSQWMVEATNKFNPSSYLSMVLRTMMMKESATTNVYYHIGSNAVPCLLEWMDYERPAWSIRLGKYLSGAGKPRLFQSLAKLLEKPEILSSESLYVFYILGPSAEAAVPELEKLLRSPKPDVRNKAKLALAMIGPRGLPPLMAALERSSKDNRIEYIESIGIIGSGASNAIPLLAKFAKGTNAHSRPASEALRRIQTSWEKKTASEQFSDIMGEGSYNGPRPR